MTGSDSDLKGQGFKPQPLDKPDRYVVATHYFADCSMSNFWSGFRAAHVDADFKRIVDDGFTHLILLVPWSQFHRQLDDTELCPEMLSRLEYLFVKAREHNLRIVVRVGYLWENADTKQRTWGRYIHLPTSRKHRRAWARYCKLLGAFLRQFDNFAFSFLSWEEFFWPIFRHLIDAPFVTRLENAKLLGYQDYLGEVTNLESYNRLAGEACASFADIPIPDEESHALYWFCAFYDQIMVAEIFSKAKSGLKGIEYEGRIDTNHFHAPEGELVYRWRLNQERTRRPVAYFYPALVSKDDGPFGADSAIRRLKRMVSQFKTQREDGRPVFIDQFNFVTQNPDYQYIRQFTDEELESFLEQAGQALKDGTSGYGIWGYCDWVNDKIFNGAFELGQRGWTVEPPQALNDETGLMIEAGTRAYQKLYQGLRRASIVELEGKAGPDCKVKITLDGTETQTVKLDEGPVANQIQFKLDVKESIEIVGVTGRLHLHRISLFDHEFSSGMYRRDFTERPAVAQVRKINKILTYAASRFGESEANDGAKEASKTEGE